MGEEKKPMKREPIVASKLREILNRAIVDQVFRKELFKDPDAVIARLSLTDSERENIASNIDKRMYKFLESIDDQISLLSESVLCSGGGCGIA